MRRNILRVELQRLLVLLNRLLVPVGIIIDIAEGKTETDRKRIRFDSPARLQDGLIKTSFGSQEARIQRLRTVRRVGLQIPKFLFGARPVAADHPLNDRQPGANFRQTGVEFLRFLKSSLRLGPTILGSHQTVSGGHCVIVAEAGVGRRVTRVGLNGLLEKLPALPEIGSAPRQPGGETSFQPIVAPSQVSLIRLGTVRLETSQTAPLLRA